VLVNRTFKYITLLKPGNSSHCSFPGSEADHSPPSDAVVKNAWNYTSTPPIRLHGVNHKGNFTFTSRYKVLELFL